MFSTLNELYGYLLLVSILAVAVSSQEYCNSEIFNPSCPVGSVISMNQAFYGQIKIGKCIESDTGYLGCYVDYLSEMDQKCSGLQECSLPIASVSAKLNCTLPNFFTRYLEASHDCVKVQVISENCPQIDMASRKWNLLGAKNKMSNCATENKPLVVRSKPGQSINVSLTDFNWNPQFGNIKGCVARYGYIIDQDVNKVVDICGKAGRDRWIFNSQGSTVHVVFDSRMLENVRFMLHLEAIGCPQFEAPPNTWMKPHNNIIDVGCIHGDVTWKMRCIGNHWIGIQGTCKEELQQQISEGVPLKNELILGLKPVVAYVLIGSVFVVVLCVLMTTLIGFFCIRRPTNKSKMHEAGEYNMMPLFYMDNTMSGNYRNGTLHPGTNANATLHGRSMTSDSEAPQYFVLERPEEQKNNLIDDTIYQNI